MRITRFILPLTAIIASSLMSCASLSGSNSSDSVSKADTNNTVNSSPIKPILLPDSSQPSSETILNEVINRQKSLQVCDFEFNAEAAREFSQVYTGENNQHLVQLLCFMAAYQGAFTFLEVNTSSPEMEIKSLELELAGFPEYDPKTNIVSNAYKLTGAGSCIQETEHYWSGDALKLMRSELVSQVTNGCKDMGALTPSENQLITNKNVGVAKLGMTLGELKEVLGEGAKFEPVLLGIDAGEGMKVIQDGNVQYLLGFADGNQLGTANSRITMITVENPSYRTADGVGPGTPVKKAVTAYGEATLSYNWNNEGREYIKFARGLGADKAVLIRSNQLIKTDFAGIYPDTNAEFNETKKYHDHASIALITIME